MLTSVVITNPQGVTLTLPLGDTSGGYEVRDIQGLDPVAATVVSSVFANLDGEQEQSSHRGKRNIIFTLGYSSPAILELRKNLYKFFLPKSRIRMRFYAEDLDMFYLEIYGTVETCTSPLFAKEPEATISVVCVDPDFYDPEPIAWHDSTTPYDTQSLLTYDGDVETGFKMIMNVDRTLPGISIHHRTTSSGEKNYLIFNNPLVAGDVLTISTIPGKKSITRTRGGTTTSILYGLDPASVWTTLYPGSNYIKISSGGAPIAYTIEYTNRYGGL